LSKVIVITGAGQGLGRALARRLAAEGNEVVLLGRTLSKVEAVAEEIGPSAMAVSCDVASPDSVRTAFTEIARRHPKIDVLVNNAAQYEPFLVAEATDKQIVDTISINTIGPILCARAAIPMMSAGSHIVNISSESATMHFPYLTLYQTSKAALERFSESLYQELKPSGIRVTCVRAGMMIEEGKGWSNVSPEVLMRFAQACHAAGLNLRESPMSQFDSVAQWLQTVIDLPADLHVQLVALRGWRNP
jgi:3-oxoacyl-[acyl-carrier protein] reductase